MEAIFHLAIKCAITVYILHKVWILLFRHRLFGLWDRIPVGHPGVRKEPAKKERKVIEASNVVGKADTEYITKPVIEPIPLVPVESEPDDEPDEEFEVGPNMDPPSAEELYGADNVYPRVTDYSTGLSYEQLTDAIGYVAAPVEDDERMMRTAETLSKIRNSDLFDFIEREVSSTEVIGRLMDECLDVNGERLPKRRSKMPPGGLSEFNIDTYV